MITQRDSLRSVTDESEPAGLNRKFKHNADQRN
jgi:hypothetical protein